MNTSNPALANSVSQNGSAKSGGRKKGDRAYKPRLAVQGAVPNTKVSFSIKKTAAALIADYARFLSELQREEVTEDAVLEALAFELQKDRGFAKWLASESAKPRTSASPQTSVQPSVQTSAQTSVKPKHAGSESRGEV